MRSWALKGSMLYLPNYTRKKLCGIEALSTVQIQLLASEKISHHKTLMCK